MADGVNRPGTPAERTRALLTDPDTFGTTLLLLTVDAFGPECLGDKDDPDRGPWHPSTFASMLAETFGVRVPKANLDKLLAAVTIVTTDLFFKNADRFVTLANTLCGAEFDPTTWDKADALECAWAITEALLLDPPDADDPEPFADDVRRYVGAVLRDEGFVTPPDVLRVALDGDFSSTVRYNFSDDPEMFQGIYAVQQEKAAEVEAVLRDCLLSLRDQVAALSLRDGSTAELLEGIGRMLKLNEPTPEAPSASIL